MEAPKVLCNSRRKETICVVDRCFDISFLRFRLSYLFIICNISGFTIPERTESMKKINVSRDKFVHDVSCDMSADL